MVTNDSDVILAIDGGGTRCRFALIVGRERFTCELGPANAFTDFEGAVRCITTGVGRLAASSGVDAEVIYGSTAYIGLAGASVEATRARLNQVLRFTVAKYEDDRNAAIQAAFGDLDGFLAHCGTGSFFAFQLAGARRLFGGWGAILGDEASGSWMGKKALAAVLEHIDGRKYCPGFAVAILDQLENSDGILRFASSASPEQFGEFAPYVTEHAAQGDSICKQILCEGASLISQSLDNIGWTPGKQICLTGGLAPEYSEYLPVEKAQSLIAPAGHPIEGAIALAKQFQKDRQIGS